MKTTLYIYPMLLSAVAFLLTECDPPEPKTPELDNQISFDGQIHEITAAGTSVEDAVYLFSSRATI